ncbi:MAG: GGDEF domain-containing protein [Agathobacter sp.]|nr:GGDEF domain-containing protein [Agathobacter sp.]
MIEKYYNGVIEQVYSKVGVLEENIVMACYSSDFSIGGLDTIEEYSKNKDGVYFSSYEYEYNTIVGAYEPFLDIICNMYKEKIGGDFAEFLEECGVYYLQKKTLISYYETGVCTREESVLLNEAEYERGRMTEAISEMLVKLSEIMPMVIVINRFQMASRSTIEALNRILRKPTSRIGMVLGTNEMMSKQNATSAGWNALVEKLEDRSHVYHIGDAGRNRNHTSRNVVKETVDYDQMQQQLANIIDLLDFEQATKYLLNIEHQIRFEDVKISDHHKLKLYFLHIKAAILQSELTKALELLEEVAHLNVPEDEHEMKFKYAYYMGICNMYQGNLDVAQNYARQAIEIARLMQDEKRIFKGELLLTQAKMSGWYNIFFCVQDVVIEESLIEKLLKYNHKNNLAHIYIYAYDNRPEVVAKAYRSEASLVYFSKGVALAKAIGNDRLIYNAYQKNIMIASTNGMNEISILYSVRTYQSLREDKILEKGRIYTGMGYNLSALGYNDMAENYYNRAIELFYKLRLPEDIAEAYYNMSLNDIMRQQYDKAEHELLMCMKTIERLHLNSLRVCNLSKLYALLALVCILQMDRFNCERYLLSCKQFLDYVIEKEKDKSREIIHDYARCDDDMFLFTFATALMTEMEGREKEAMAQYEKAERFLASAEGNQFFCYHLFREKRMELFKKMGHDELYETEKLTMEQHEELCKQISEGVPKKLLKEVELGDYDGPCRISEDELEELMKQEGMSRDYMENRRQMDFLSAWQKQIDVTGEPLMSMVSNAMKVFLTNFNVDCALYIRYDEGRPRVLYNNTKVEMTPEILADIEKSMKKNTRGFAVSKISADFSEHSDVISYFGKDEICSFVVVPYFTNGRLRSLLITYVGMRDNWHTSVNRFMLNENDLNIFQLLFREMDYSINRMEAYEKVYEMNKKLQASAVTDALTGIYNRAGMYEEINKRLNGKMCGWKTEKGVSLMFCDLDNFKHYNDTYGHDVGDLILVEMAKIFDEVSREIGFVSRYGGDEFIIILNTSVKEELEEIGKKIYARIDAADGFKDEIEKRLHHTIEIDPNRKITCSIGIAMDSQAKNESDLETLIKKADDSLYTVKTGGKGYYAFI